MKFLLDSCVSGRLAERLRDAGHDAMWTGDWPADPGDSLILATAAAEQRILVTIDKDFGELAIVQGHPHSGLIRLIGFRVTEQGDAILRIISTHRADLEAKAIITLEPWRVRVRSVNADT